MSYAMARLCGWMVEWGGPGMHLLIRRVLVAKGYAWPARLGL
jgi:hypothetical protein